jgi:hypothetical protein
MTRMGIGGYGGPEKSSSIPRHRVEVFSEKPQEPVANVRILQRVGDIGHLEAGLAPAVESAAFEDVSVNGLLGQQFGHGIGDLDFTPGAGFLFSSMSKISGMRI